MDGVGNGVSRVHLGSTQHELLRHSISAALLAGVKSLVRFGQKGGGIRGRVGAGRDAQARRNLPVLPRSVFDGAPNPFGNRIGVATVGLGEHHDELLPSITRHMVSRSDVFSNDPGHLLEHFVARRVAKTVIEGLETVHIDQDDGKGLLMVLGLIEKVPECVLEGSVVLEASQTIFAGQGLEFGVGFLELLLLVVDLPFLDPAAGDVLQGDQHRFTAFPDGVERAHFQNEELILNSSKFDFLGFPRTQGQGKRGLLLQWEGFAEQGACGGIEKLDALVPIQDDHPVRHVFQQRPEVFSEACSLADCSRSC